MGLQIREGKPAKGVSGVLIITLLYHNNKVLEMVSWTACVDYK